jgi:hypothetical protein
MYWELETCDLERRKPEIVRYHKSQDWIVCVRRLRACIFAGQPLLSISATTGPKLVLSIPCSNQIA